MRCQYGHTGCVTFLLPFLFTQISFTSATPSPRPDGHHADTNDSGDSFVLEQKYIGKDFVDGFNWETFNDPTHGRVNYVDQQTALRNNLSSYSADKFFMRADAWSQVGAKSRGRDSVRISSKDAYDEAVLVIDLTHMPEGCGTWPAFWTVTNTGPWPYGGELDIIEGVNKNTKNLASLHTSDGCTQTSARSMSGSPTSTDCDAFVNGNQGCGVAFNKPASYGAPFNANGGGWFAVQRTISKGVSVWFWPRDDPAVPEDVKLHAPSVQPDQSWGQPEARFTPDTCDFGKHFNAAKIIFDLTFCGDWAGHAYGSAGCPGTCDDFVNNNPHEFANAYWEVNSLMVYSLLRQSSTNLLTSNTGSPWYGARHASGH